MEPRNIQTLLEKYWQGTSSLQEEEALRVVLHAEDVPEQFKIYQELFLPPMPSSDQAQLQDAPQLSAVAEDKMMDFFKGLEKSEDKRQGAKVLSLNRTSESDVIQPKRNWMRIAAAAAMIFGIGWFWTIQTNRMIEQERVAALETYEQTKEALALLGMHFNNGETKTLQGVKQASERLDVFSDLN